MSTGISLCMIVKNEEKFIQGCLESVKSIVDDIIIVDTGSTDGTLDLIRPFNPKIFHYTWNNDFAAARRGYDPDKTSETYEQEEAERAKPLYRVQVVNRDAW